MSIQRFDTLIAGDDISGLVAANLLTHFHYKVIVLRNTTPADRYLSNGFTLPVSPFLLPPLEFGELMAQCKQFLSISQSEFEDESEKFDKMQYITRRLRIDLSTHKDETVEEFASELGLKKDTIKNFILSAHQKREKIISFFNNHPPYPLYSFWDKRKFNNNSFKALTEESSILKYFDNEREKILFKTILLFLQAYDTKKIVSSQESLLGFLFQENWFLLSSIEKLKSLLIKRLADKGVLILDGTVNKYTIEKRGFNYYIIDERHHNRYHIDSVMISTDATRFKEIISERLWEKLKINCIESYIRFTTNFVVPSKVIPDIASKVIFLKNNNFNNIVEDSFQMTISKAMRGRAIIKENSVISVTFFVKPQDYNKKNVEKLNKRAENVLYYVFPFAENNIIDISSVLETDTIMDINLKEIKKHNFNPSMLQYYGGELKDGILLTEMKTGIDNFINVSSTVFAPLGIFGDFMVAIRGSEIISKNILGK